MGKGYGNVRGRFDKYFADKEGDPMDMHNLRDAIIDAAEAWNEVYNQGVSEASVWEAETRLAKTVNALRAAKERE